MYMLDPAEIPTRSILDPYWIPTRSIVGEVSRRVL